MSSPNPQMSLSGAAPLMQQAFRLEFPQSLGMFREYKDVQRMVDALADAGFPVQHTLIVGTDLRMVERVTGRQTWGRVIGGGIMSGIWMGSFIGLLFAMFSGNLMQNLVTSILLGIVFFTVWAVIRYATSRGQRDFTSMAATVPMQFELLVEHRHFSEAKRALGEAGIRLGYGAFGSGGGAPAAGAPNVGAPRAGTPAVGGPSVGVPGAAAPHSADASSDDDGRRPTYGAPASASDVSSDNDSALRPSYGESAEASTAAHPSYSREVPASSVPKQEHEQEQRRPQFGLPSDDATVEDGSTGDSSSQDPSTGDSPAQNR